MAASSSSLSASVKCSATTPYPPPSSSPTAPTGSPSPPSKSPLLVLQPLTPISTPPSSRMLLPSPSPPGPSGPSSSSSPPLAPPLPASLSSLPLPSSPSSCCLPHLLLAPHNAFFCIAPQGSPVSSPPSLLWATASLSCWLLWNPFLFGIPRRPSKKYPRRSVCRRLAAQPYTAQFDLDPQG
ncbi:hypothetical protein GOP47_0020883 [Adiantum capillus-veneris]|uniref:Uncharacterized protein n=1 Tax=Adiantum capillus-veneris TaxID=13818 RepID=A0A9D4UA13_ADICA|nr:hypothetical protein GOP47_0020883 [Adiantum capillus-veneris]